MPHKFPVESKHILIDPERKESTDPQRVIGLLPIQPHHVVADIGCGPGFFTIPFAKHLAQGRVFAVDMQQGMLDEVKARVEAEGLGNVDIRLSGELDIPLEKTSLDGVFLAYMLHETEGPLAFLRIIKKILKDGGWLCLLEWVKEEMEEGPPLEERIAEEDALELVQKAGFKVTARPKINEKHYIFVLANAP